MKKFGGVAVAVGIVVLALPGTAAAKTCTIKDPRFFTSKFTVTGTTCSAGSAVLKGVASKRSCYKATGSKTCTVREYRCTSRAYNPENQASYFKVTCTRGARVIKGTYGFG